MVTGESVPVEKGVGDEVVGSTINENGVLVVEATNVGEDTALQQIVETVKAAQSRQPGSRTSPTASRRTSSPQSSPTPSSGASSGSSSRDAGRLRRLAPAVGPGRQQARSSRRHGLRLRVRDHRVRLVGADRLSLRARAGDARGDDGQDHHRRTTRRAVQGRRRPRTREGRRHRRLRQDRDAHRGRDGTDRRGRLRRRRRCGPGRWRRRHI